MNRIERYLSACQIKAFWEDSDIHTPPTADEVKCLIEFLRQRDRRLRPRIVGSVALAWHLRNVPVHKIRGTNDIDIFVHREPGPPPDGWRIDPECLGFPSYISPSGGYCDLLVANHVYANGGRNPQRVRMSGDRRWELPVADIVDLFLMKLNTDRLEDLVHAVALARVMDGIPKEVASNKKLTHTQRENLADLELWLRRIPTSRT